MTKAAPSTAELEPNGIEGMNNEKLMHFVKLIIQLDNERIKEEAKAKEELKQ